MVTIFLFPKTNNGNYNIGQDGKPSGANSLVARDAYGYNLNYFSGDYKPIGGSIANSFATEPN